MAEEKGDKQKGIGQQGGGPEGGKAAQGKSWFFGIGIDHYQEFPGLNNAVKDVADIRHLLLNQYDIAEDCTSMLTNEAATREGIIDQLDVLVAEIGKWDKLVIYYSGHGHLDKKTDLGYWIPHDARQGRTANYLRNSTIRDYLKVINARHTLLISDACFSGSLFVRGTQRSEIALHELEQHISRWAICSGRHDEAVYDGAPGENSPFAESILDILRHNQKPKINVAKLADRVVELTRANYEQLPEGNPLYGVGHKGGQYIFRLKAKEGEDWISCKTEDTLPAYRRFLEKYPKGQFAQAATEKRDFLEEEEVWEKSSSGGTIVDIYEYARRYPKGRYHRQALDAIAELEQETVWQEAIARNKISVYSKYLSEYPQGKYKAEAEAKMEAIILGQQESPPLPPRPKKQEPKKPSEEKKAAPSTSKQNPLPTTSKLLTSVKKQSRWLVLLLLPFVVWLIFNIVKSSSSEPDLPTLSTTELSQLVDQLGLEVGQLQFKQDENGLIVFGEVKSQSDKEKIITALKGVAGIGDVEDQLYSTIRLNGKTWLTENLNYEIGDSWCYKNKTANCIQYGRLYNWKSAQEACKALGSDWRLPTDEEWKGLAEAYGGYHDWPSKKHIGDPKKAYQLLIQGGNGGFQALLGGWRNSDGSFKYLGSDGYHWSSTEKDEDLAWFYYYFLGKLNRNYSTKALGLSCRCIKD